MKLSSGRNLISIWILVFSANLTLSQIVRLDEALHLYELSTSETKLQPFEYTVGGSGQCSEEIDAYPGFKAMELKTTDAKTLIYPDYENTLSFMIAVSFKLSYSSSKQAFLLGSFLESSS